jgi:hypothetical protein
LLPARGDLLGSEALGLGSLGRREELLDLGRRWPHGLETHRRRRQRPAALLPRQIRLQIAQLAVRLARRRRFPPEFQKTTNGNDVRSSPESIIRQNSRGTRVNSPTSRGPGRTRSWWPSPPGRDLRQPVEPQNKKKKNTEFSNGRRSRSRTF